MAQPTIDRSVRNGVICYGATLVINSIKTRCWSLSLGEIQSMVQEYA